MCRKTNTIVGAYTQDHHEKLGAEQHRALNQRFMQQLAKLPC